MLADLRALIPTLAARAGKTETPPAGSRSPDYDELNAGQVVARLSQLTQDELAAVLAYERAHRNRRAVVEKAEQLTATPAVGGIRRATQSTRSSSGSMARSRARCATTRAATAAGWRSSKPRSESSAAPLDRRAVRRTAARPRRRSEPHRKTCDALTSRR